MTFKEWIIFLSCFAVFVVLFWLAMWAIQCMIDKGIIAF